MVDNLDIGGIQRLAFDEAYFLSDFGEEVEILVQAETQLSPMQRLDQEFSGAQKLKIQYVGIRRSISIYRYFALFKTRSTNLVITHSLSSCFALRIALFLCGKKTPLLVFVHQSLGLSSKLQKMKRFIYSLFASEVVFGSINFSTDWKFQIRQKQISLKVPQKNYSINSLGVYLPRIFEIAHKSNLVCEDVPHLVFASRITEWKGFTKFREIVNLESLAESHVVVMTASNSRRYQISDIRGNRNHLLYDLQPGKIASISKPVHLYPTNYGNSVRTPLPIGLNVLEFLALGIPSIISIGGMESYKNLQSNSLIIQVDWKDLDQVNMAINSATQLTKAQREMERLKCQEFVSIKNHGEFLLSKRAKHV